MPAKGRRATLNRAPASLPGATAPVAPPEPPPAPETPFNIDPGPHATWARMVARGVRAGFGFEEGSQEEKELEAVALYYLCRGAMRYDPARLRAGSTHTRAFRGWLHQDLVNKCKRAAAKLREHGLAMLPADPDARALVLSGRVPRDRCANCSAVVVSGPWTARPWYADEWDEGEPAVLADVPFVVEKPAQPEALAEAIRVAKAQK